MSGNYIGGVNKQEAFLCAYGQCANLSKAAKAAGITRDMHYQWMRNDPDYPALFAQSKIEAAQSIEDEAVRRAHEGIVEPVIYQGQRCFEYIVDVDPTDPTKTITRREYLTITKYSDMLLAKILPKFNPEYREKGSMELTGANGGPLDTELTVRFVKPE